MSKPNAKVSTLPTTASAPTTCDPPGARASVSARALQLRFGHIPGNAPTVEGLQRKLEPLSFFFSSPTGDISGTPLASPRRPRPFDEISDQQPLSVPVFL